MAFAKLKPIQKALIFGLLWALFVVVAIPLSDVKNSPPCTALKESDLTMLDYHTAAVNFALDGRLQIMGIVRNETAYAICPEDTTDTQNEVGRAVRHVFKNSGPLVLLYRPPLLSLLLGCAYKCFGVSLMCGYMLNIFFLSLTAALMPFTSSRLWGTKGFVCGIIAGFIFLKTDATLAQKIGPESLVILILALILFATVRLANEFKSQQYLVIGFLLGLALLTKGNTIFIPVLYVLFIGASNRNHLATAAKKITLVSASAFITLLPWIILANYLRVNSVSERQYWKESIKHYSPDLISKNKNFELQKATTAELIELMTKVFYVPYAEADNFVVITNQLNFKGKAFWWIHNEACIDGLVHPEVELTTNSYYNTHYPTITTWVKIFYFYRDNPAYLSRIAIGKIHAASRDGFWFYWMACLLWGFCILQIRLYSSVYKHKKTTGVALLLITLITVTYTTFYPSDSNLPLYLALLVTGICLYKVNYNHFLPVLLPIVIVNSFLICVIFQGEPRYLAIIDGIAIPCSVYMIGFMCLNMIKNLKGTLQLPGGLKGS